MSRDPAVLFVEVKCIGDAPLVQVDIHLSPRFIQENLG
jgi:hypothetical protein